MSEPLPIATESTRSGARERWVVPPIDADATRRLATEMGCSTVLATLLIRRGVHDPDDGKRFLDPKLMHLVDPSELPGMAAAVDRIEAAIRSREPIAIFGDYDVDGVSSTCLLADFFRLIDYPVRCRLPHRLLEGYGIRASSVRELAEEGARLIITVDNGSSAVEAVETAREAGVDVVIVDHHEIGDPAPSPVAFVNPLIGGPDAVCRDLAGVGVTFKLVWALCERFSKAKKLSDEFRQFLLDSLALVALGTIADVVPLHGENRALAKFGLPSLVRSPRPGLRRLLECCGRGGRVERLESHHVAFRIGPRLNAAGRLGRAELALEILETLDDARAVTLKDILENENTRRREIDDAMYRSALDRVREEYDLDRDRAIVLGDPEWHTGVVGIVASRLVEDFYRPTLLVARGEDGRFRGSARSIPGVHINECLARCAEHLVGFGGHAMAAGCEVEPERLDDLRAALHEAVDVAPEAMVREVEVDCEVTLRQLGPKLLEELSALEPFGEGNRAPVFLVRDAEVVGSPRRMGASGSHLSFHVRDPARDGGEPSATFRAVAFGRGDLASQLERGRGGVSLLCRPKWNEWRGRRDIEVDVRDIAIGP